MFSLTDMTSFLASSNAFLLSGLQDMERPSQTAHSTQWLSKLLITWICRYQQDLVCLLRSFSSVMVSIGLSLACCWT